MSTAKFKHGHIIKLWWAEWKLILKEWLKESLILHILKITITDDGIRWLHPLEYTVQGKQNLFTADRGQPDLNRWPLDLQSNALPLSYAPRLKDYHEPTNPDSKVMANVPKMDWLIDLFTLALLFQAPNHPRMCRYRLKSAPITALAGKRTRASRVAGENSTTEPPVPVWELKEASHLSGPPHSEAKRWQISSHFVSAILSWKPNREQVCYTTEYPPGPWTMLFIHSRWVATEVEMQSTLPSTNACKLLKAPFQHC